MSMQKLLVIDDEYDIGTFIQTVAQDIGFEATATHRPDIFQQLYSADLDVIVLDLIMPDMDGIELLRFLASNNCRAAIILISGFDTGVLHSAQKLATEQGLRVTGTLTKPIRHADLVATLRDTPTLEKEFEVPLQREPSQEELHEALAQKQLINHYQPQLDINTGSMVGVEALVRWQHPDRGLLSPNLFIPVAEKTGLIGEVTVAVLEQALQQCENWLRAGLHAQVSVNMRPALLQIWRCLRRFRQWPRSMGCNRRR